MGTIDPDQFFETPILIVAPHMDDETLACGGLIARLSRKDQVHVIYATDGMKSPAPVFAGHGSISPDLGEVRVRESIRAMTYLGLPEQNLCFYRYPEAELRKNGEALSRRLAGSLAEIKPATIFVPFRYDRHPDHLAVNHALGALNPGFSVQVVEYFVYYRWRLLPAKDIRRYIRPEHLLEVDIADVSARKRTALDCFTSQTTIYYDWQTRPILRPELLDEECRNPEIFLLSNLGSPGSAVFSRGVLWIKMAHRLEPFLQRWKYYVSVWLKQGRRANA
ncbi:MAG: PIG-L family deacetylase [Anaerolineales bacterium]|nr:PIG-L family deacetylase [Anaerolineales bacterium]